MRVHIAMSVNGISIESAAAKEINSKINDSNLLFLYNSTTSHEELFYGRTRSRMFYDFMMSVEEKKALREAQKTIEQKMRRLAKTHTRSLSDVIGRLSEKYDVEASPPEGLAIGGGMPVGINLKDKNVDVPLGDWGSGTQNRTHILMAILQANRIKSTSDLDEEITPFVVVEEPESFLHPSAQAEFGKILKSLSAEFGIQIIATTHSPHMLNQEEPESNILLERVTRRSKPCETKQVLTTGDNWMAPFADHLGINPEQFKALRPIFSSVKTRVLLVEGPIDVEYFKELQGRELPLGNLHKEIEIIPYGGKDSIKNAILFKFILCRFDKVFITFDLDAKKDVTAALNRLSLTDGEDYCAVGINSPGRDCIEGILPHKILSAVNGRETDLVMRLGSNEKKHAKDALKKKYLDEFKAQAVFTKDELKELGKIVKVVNDRLAT